MNSSEYKEVVHEEKQSLPYTVMLRVYCFPCLLKKLIILDGDLRELVGRVVCGLGAQSSSDSKATLCKLGPGSNPHPSHRLPLTGEIFGYWLCIPGDVPHRIMKTTKKMIRLIQVRHSCICGLTVCSLYPSHSILPAHAYPKAFSPSPDFQYEQNATLEARDHV